MFFLDYLLHKKLLTLLNPWLAQPPHLHLSLGFLRSLLTLRDLRLDAAVLDTLSVDGGDGLRLLVKSVSVDEVVVRVANWSAPAFSVDIRGLNVALLIEKGGSRRGDVSVEEYLEERKRKLLAEIDYEGNALLDSVEKLIMDALSKTGLKDSITNLVLANCCFHLYDARVRVEFPVSEDKFSWLCYSRELTAESSHKGLGCLFGGFVRLLFLPLRETSFNLEACELELGSLRKDDSNCILSCVKPHINIRMIDFHLVNFVLSVPEMNLFFSPSQLQMVQAFNSLFDIKCKHKRSGRLLWQIARSKIHYSLLPPECMLYKAVLVAVLWLRLVKEYQDLLELVGYPENGLKVPDGHQLSRSAEEQRKIIYQKLEKELPAEAIVSARQVACHRATMKASHAEDIAESHVSPGFGSFWRIILPLAVIWWATVSIIKKVLSIIFFCIRSPEVGQLRMTFEVAHPRRCFHVILGKISAVVSSIDAICPPINKKAKYMKKTPQTDLILFFLSAKGFSFTYEEGICEQYMFFSLGFLEVTSAPISHDSQNETESRHIGSALAKHLERLDDLKPIVWAEPAQLCCHAEEGETGHRAVPNLKQLSSELEMIHKKMQLRFQGLGVQYDGSPWAVWVSHTFPVYPGIKIPSPGFSKCSLMVGKLNFILGYTLVSSITTLFEKVQHALYQLDDSESAVVPNHSPTSFQDSNKMSCSAALKSSVQRLEMTLFKLLPVKHVEVRAVVAGPRVQISLRNEEVSSSTSGPNAKYVKDAIYLTIDAQNMDFAVCPTAKSGFELNVEHQRPDDSESELYQLHEKLADGLFEPGNMKNGSIWQIFLCYHIRLGGLSAYLEDLKENNPTQILLLKPVSAELLSLRDHLHSFGKSVVASSLSLSGAMTGVTGLFFMDELSMILQVVESLVSAASMPTPGNSTLDTSGNHQVISEQQVLQTEPINEDILTGIDERAIPNIQSGLFYISASVELGPFDMIFHNSRNSTDKTFSPTIFDPDNTRKLGLTELPDSGIWLTIQKLCLDISIGEEKVEIDVKFRGFHAIMFRFKDQNEGDKKPELKIALMPSVESLREVSLSECTFGLLLDFLEDSGSLSEADRATSNGSPEGSDSDLPLTSDSKVLNSKLVKGEGFESNDSALEPSHWLLINLTVDVIFTGTSSDKNALLGAHPVDKLQLSVSVGGDFQVIFIRMQGGLILVETSVLERFAHCFTSYLDFVTSLSCMKYSHRKSMETAEHGANVSILGKQHIQQPAQSKTSSSCPAKWELLEAFHVDLSRFSFVLIAIDESSVLKEINGSVAFSLKLSSENRKKKFLFNLYHLAILSQTLGCSRPQRETVDVPHFSSVGLSYEPLSTNPEDSPEAVLREEKTSVVSTDASCSNPLASTESSSAIDSASAVIEASGSYGKYILERLVTSIAAEELIFRDENSQHCVTQGWVGHGSVSGLNITISLSDIQVLMAAVESLSKISGKRSTNDVDERSWASVNHVSEKDSEAALPDGAIVAIQDVHQHMFVTVESVESKYNVTGAVHYSLAGRRALFRVKWQKQRGWFSSTSWFSLTSLYAKNDSGDPLRLNYCASSGFVGISCNNDSACALWKSVSCKNEIYEDDADLDPLNHLSKNIFYLVNKKNDCAAAFNQGALEFVKKPGNPFKFKVFSGIPLHHNIVTSESFLLGDRDPSLMDGQKISDQAAIFPCITLTIEKVSLIIVHELADAKDKLPLLQGSIDGHELTIQILPQKTRVISTLTTVLYYFDVQNILWKELAQPIDICIYWRSTSESQVKEIPNPGVRSHLYFKMQELDVSLTELPLDILLYMIGKLNLAGPFNVKSSAILANCCKVENKLKLDLLCHFYNAQSKIVGSEQSAFFFLRHLVDRLPEASYATISLEVPGISSTTSIHIPLAETQIFAWRTRIKLLRDPRTYPGPVIVFDISKNAEEGLSVTISPLLRIHNKTTFPIEVRIQRPESMEEESASVLLREGDTVDDCVAAFDAISLAGGSKKALLSLGVGNFVFSFRPEIKKESDSCLSCSAEWSDNLEGGKAVRLSGVIDKLTYQVRKAFSAQSWKYSFTTAGCSVRSGNAHEATIHFLVQRVGRDVPIMQPDDRSRSKSSSIALQEQKEIFLLPTVRVSNFLDSDIVVILTDTEKQLAIGLENINQATIPCGLSVDLYANPAVIFFTVKLSVFDSSCKPVNCGQLLKKLNKKKEGIQFLDIDLDFCGGKYFACLRLARGDRGVLEAIVFTQYTLRNDSQFFLFCGMPNLRPLHRDEAEKHVPTIPPYLGSFLPPKSIRSWFMKSTKVRMNLSDEQSSESYLDLDALSGLAEISFTKMQGSGVKQLIKLGISLGPLMSKVDMPARMVSIVPRYVISNESDERIFIRQCFLEDGLEETISVSSKQKTALLLRVGSSDKQDINVFDKMLRKHKVSDDDASIFLQFTSNETSLGWSGPVCVASLGRFFLKFKSSVESPLHQSDFVTREDGTNWEYAAVHVVEEASTFVLHLYKPPDIDLPYRIENHLHNASVTFYQKETFDPETLLSRGSVDYVWDDLTRPHKLMVKINGIDMVREISLDKLRPWKPFFRIRQQSDLASNLPFGSRISGQRGADRFLMNGFDVEKLGYEVYADGPTRVLRICQSPGSRKVDRNFQSFTKIQLRISYLSIRLLEACKQDPLKKVDPSDVSNYTPILVVRLEDISVDSIIIDQRKYNQMRVQSMNVDEKWVGAPFAAMLRRHLTSSNDADDSVLFVVFVLYPTSSNVSEVKYSSVVLQPIDLNLDEETLMKIVPFWRTSLSTARSQQYYFDHFEIHPVKIIASFLPEESYSNYSSGQEALRSLLHSVIKIPATKNIVVELNGVLVTHALVTTRELLMRCARHYSWYAMRAIYIAKGSSLLPPTFASVFDDLASSSLDVFFDPSSSLFNVRGLTLGTFKLISKCIENKGFSGTKRYFGDLNKTLKNAGSNILFAAVTEISDSVLKGAESSGLNGMVTGFHHGILKLAMEPSFLGTAFLEGGPDRKIKLDRSPGVDELYIEGYLQAMLDTMYKQEYLRVRVIDDQVILKNLPPNSSLIEEIMDRVNDFLVSKALLKGEYSTSSRPLRHLRGENEWRIGPTVLTLCEHLFVSFAIRMLRKQTNNVMGNLKLKEKLVGNHEESKSNSSAGATTNQSKGNFIWRWGIGKFALSAGVAYIDGRLCRCIPNPVVRRIVSGFLLSFLDNNNSK